jgi:hypothetical protein
MDTPDWEALFSIHLPEVPFNRETPWVSWEDLAWRTDDAHHGNDIEFLQRCYGFVRWSICHAPDEKTKGWIADWFFARILLLGHSKRGCLDYLDWNDVRLLTEAFTVEPSFNDTGNFEALTAEWRRRWSRNQKLPPPDLSHSGDRP